MNMKKIIARILSIFLILTLVPVTSFAAEEWDGKDIPEGETATLTKEMFYGNGKNATIRGELIVDSCKLTLGLKTGDTLTVSGSGKITIKNDGYLLRF